MNGNKHIDGLAIQSDEDDFGQKVRDLLIGHRIVKTETVGEQHASLTLENGVVLEIAGNEGCGGCNEGWYSVSELNGCENIITNVEFEIENWADDGVPISYKIHVFADNKKITCLNVEGSDNGYYGTGFWLTVIAGEGEY